MQKAKILKRISAAALAAVVSLAVILPVIAVGDLPKVYTVNMEQTGWTDENNVRAASAADPVDVAQWTAADVSAAGTLPSSFDGRTKGYLTSVKNQGAANCCWAFSCVSAIEADYIKQGFGSIGKTDFSEAYMTWFGQRQRTTNKFDPTYGDGVFYEDPFSFGGNWQIMASSVFRGSGMQLESNAPWYFTSVLSELKPHMTLSENDRYVSYARLWSAEGLLEPAWKDAWGQVGKKESEINQLWSQAKAEAVVKAKQRIMENGAVTISYYHDKTLDFDPFYNSANHAYYQNWKSDGTNHSVAVVGWDDNFSRTLFNASCRPPVDGAWLVKGSWGTVYGDNGYYWLSYADPSIRNIAAFKTTKADIYTNIYQYDGCYPSTFTECKSGSSMANIFMSGSEEILSHIVFYSPNITPVDALIEVYLSNDASPQIGPDHDPTKYMKRVDAASTALQAVPYGYTTLSLLSEVTLQAGQPFAVKITFSRSDGSKVWIPIEGADQFNDSITYGGHAGESFIKPVDGRWYDTSSFVGLDLNNVPIKAMTRDADAAAPELHLTSAPDRTQYRIGETLDTGGMTLAYLDSKGRQSAVMSGYTLSQTQPFDQPGDTEITVTYAGLNCSFTVHVDRTPGDSNGDGVLDLKDVTLMRRALAGWSGAAVYDANLDVNGDGKLSLLDVALMTRYLAGGYNIVLK